MREVGEDVEKHARVLAMWHGQKIVSHDREQGAMTIAARHGFGKWGDSPSRYSEAHWREYTAAAEYVLEQIAEARDEAHYDAQAEASERS